MRDIHIDEEDIARYGEDPALVDSEKANAHAKEALMEDSNGSNEKV